MTLPSPPLTSALAEEFPVGSQVRVYDRTYYVLGYTDDDELLLTTLNPRCYPLHAQEEHEAFGVAAVREDRQ